MSVDEWWIGRLRCKAAVKTCVANFPFASLVAVGLGVGACVCVCVCLYYVVCCPPLHFGVVGNVFVDECWIEELRFKIVVQ